MLDALGAALALAMMGLIAVLLASFYFLGRLVRHEYAHHRAAWERDGRPNAPFFCPRETTWFRSGMAYQRCALTWPLYTPAWMRTDPTAKALHSRLRWCVLIWNAGFITWVILFLWYLAATNASNQAMQRTASKAATDAVRVCHPPSGCVARCTGLAVADLVSR